MRDPRVSSWFTGKFDCTRSDSKFADRSKTKKSQKSCKNRREIEDLRDKAQLEKDFEL